MARTATAQAPRVGVGVQRAIVASGEMRVASWRRADGPNGNGETAHPVSRHAVPRGSPAGRVIVAPRGELDCATVARLQTAVDDLVATGWDTIVLDLRALCFMDSTGLCLIMRQTSRTDATVQLIDGTAAVGRLFDLTGVRPRLPFVPPHGPRNAGPGWLSPVSSDNRTPGSRARALRQRPCT
jgi:anti-anti-sigma factor